MATFLACPSAGTRRSAPAFAHAGRDRDASTPRSRRHREEQCHRLRPAVCAIADAGRPVRPRRRLGVPSACAAVAANGTFFSQRLGQLRTADANTLARFDLGAQAWDGPVASVGHELLQLRRDHTQRRFTLHRGGAGRHARFQRLNTAACEVTAPQANRVVAHANASAIFGLVQPASVKSTARALSASPRSREPARVASAACCSSVAVSGDFPAISYPCELVPPSIQSPLRWSTERNLLSSHLRDVSGR